MKFDQFSDGELLDQYRLSKDEKWLGILLQRYTLMIFGVCMKYLRNQADAEDASQQIFEKALLEIPKYEIPFFKSWLYSVAKNTCLMQLRARQSKPHFTDELSEDLISEEQTESELKIREWVLEERIHLLKDAINKLNKEQAACIEMFYLQKRSYLEIEQETGMNFKEVKSHIQNGKRNLKKILEQKIATL